jgi:DNA-binding FadR family transcriptional regulator
VEIKQGKGTFVKTVDLGLFMKPLFQLIDFEEIDVEAIYTAR